MIKNYNFHKPNNGKEGEHLAKQWLESRGWRVEDVSNAPEYWGQDIDLLCRDDEEVISVEVKWDYNIGNTGNMFIETTTDIDEGKVGWYGFCCADYIYYGDGKNKQFYVFRTEYLKEYIENNKKRLPQRKAADRNKYGEVKKVGEGYLVSISDFTQQYPVEIIKL